MIGEEPLHLGILKLHFTENDGMAFGAVFPFKGAKIALSLLRLVAITVIFLYIKKLLAKQKVRAGLLFAVSCILAGAIGNVIDGSFYGLIFSESYGEVARFMPVEGGYAPFLHGRVVDMLQFTIPCPKWLPWYNASADHTLFPFIFNIADAAITVGISMIFIWQKRYFPKHEVAPEQVTSSSNLGENIEELNKTLFVQQDLINQKIREYSFLKEMYEDDYFPDFLVDKAKNILLTLCFNIETKKPESLEELYKLTHNSTLEFNELQEEFNENDSEIETAARDSIGVDFEYISTTYGFEADTEELIAPREW